MARFSLKEGISERLLGRGLLLLATLKAIARKSELAKETENQKMAESALPIFQEYMEENYFDVSKPQGPMGHEKQVKVQYHFDGPSSNGYMLHIVVPDIGDKEIDLVSTIEDGGLPKEARLPRQSERLAGTPTYDFTDFAAESLGHIVIFGCGR